MPRLTAFLTLMSLVVLLVGGSTNPAASAQGKSENAHRCQNGDWADLAPSEDPTVPFSSQGECVRYGAQGGTIVALDETITARVVVTMGPSDGTYCLVTLTLVDGRPGMIVNVRVETSTIGYFFPTFFVDDGFVEYSGNVPVGTTFPGGAAALWDSDGNPIVGLPVDLPTTACGA